ncbi:uncharacterized protein SCHCODRAFT_02605056 [Schizophyllum commune H4-8]|nr:uncharacterized protein SCHCODRAFT_02605056 [Schizophyllum commune H4-8]KAI5899404.1 hypothetical protein SCHCODRAFT_02605056 [Schizophyllum commune H4-8]
MNGIQCTGDPRKITDGDTADALAANGQAVSKPAIVLRTAQDISTAPPLACTLKH